MEISEVRMTFKCDKAAQCHVQVTSVVKVPVQTEPEVGLRLRRADGKCENVFVKPEIVGIFPSLSSRPYLWSDYEFVCENMSA